MNQKDTLILEQLMRDGRKSAADIARALKMPRATVQSRIVKMNQEGIIKQFKAIPDFEKLGRPIKAYILVQVKGGLSVRSVAEKIAGIPQTGEVVLISGPWDILLSIRTTSVEEMGSLVDRLKAIKGVFRTNTCFSFQNPTDS